MAVHTCLRTRPCLCACQRRRWNERLVPQRLGVHAVGGAWISRVIVTQPVILTNAAETIDGNKGLPPCCDFLFLCRNLLPLSSSTAVADFPCCCWCACVSTTFAVRMLERCAHVPRTATCPVASRPSILTPWNCESAYIHAMLLVLPPGGQGAQRFDC